MREEKTYCHEEEHDHEHHDCCSHEHHHDHDHEHHDCCDHDHDHHDCCDHDHHHEQHLEEGFSPIHVYMHDTAVVASVKCHINGEYDACIQQLKTCMQNIAEQIEKKDGVVGHIKAYVREDARNCMISVTDGENICVKPDHGNGIDVENANIVFGISMDDIEEILKKEFAQWI